MNTTTVILLVSNCLIAIIVPLALAFMKIHAAAPETNDTFKQSKGMVITSLIFLLFFISISILATYLYIINLEMEKLFIPVCVYLITLGVLWLFLSALNYRLIVNEDVLVYVNFLGIKKKYRYEEITQVIGYYDRHGKYLEKYIICIGKKKIEINLFYGNLPVFLSLIKKRLKKHENRLKIEYKKSRI